jgi:hypothetical protein
MGNGIMEKNTVLRNAMWGEKNRGCSGIVGQNAITTVL